MAMTRTYELIDGELRGRYSTIPYESVSGEASGEITLRMDTVKTSIRWAWRSRQRSCQDRSSD